MADTPRTYDEFMAEQQDAQSKPFQAFGKTFRIITPDLMSDVDAADFYRLMDATNPTADDLIRLASVIIDDWEGFSEAGGTATGLVAYMQELTGAEDEIVQAEQGVTVGEDQAS